MNKSSGMTLIEILVALVVFSYAALTLVTASSTNLNSLSLLKERTYADWVAQNQLAELLASQQEGKTLSSTKKGEEEMQGQIFYYSVKIEASNEWLKSVTVDVSSDKEGKHILSSVMGFVANEK